MCVEAGSKNRRLGSSDTWRIAFVKDDNNSTIVGPVGTYAVLLSERRAADGSVSIPLGPGALGYLAQTPDGYVFVNVRRTATESRELPRDFEESCF
jgi:hypothetical protein